MNLIKLIITSALIGMFMELSSLAAEEKELAGHWTFNEGTDETIADSSGNEDNGAILNGMRGVTWTAGRNGKALQFASDHKKTGAAGCVRIPGLAAKCDFSKAITIAAWIKLAPTVERGETYEIVSNVESDRGKGFRFRIAWGALAFGSGEGGDGKFWEAGSKPAHTSIKPDTWYHVAGTYNGDVFKVYLDGEEVGVSETNLPLTTGRKDVDIGAYCGGYAYGFEGVIDEVKIYSRALSAAEILKQAKLGQ